VGSSETRDRESSQAILVVEDEDYVANLAKAALSRRGYKVIVTGSGEQALQILKTGNPKIGLILLDYRMPDMSGADLVPKLQQADPNVRIIVSSGYFEGEVAQELPSGLPFLQKPYTVEKLTAAVQSALNAP
jgi:CheY-like chemotaxis protein